MSERGRRPLAIVVAVGRNGAIGQGGALPWHLPGDLARFKALTMGKPMLMGRRTFESIGKALPGRESIVVSRDGSLVLPAGVHRAATPEAGRALAQERAAAMGADEISLIGGATLFDAMIAETDRLYMTFVDLARDRAACAGAPSRRRGGLRLRRLRQAVTRLVNHPASYKTGASSHR